MSVVEPLNLPKVPLKLSKVQGQLYVWCVVRKKNLVLTPEEWVRQHLIHYLISSVGIPLERIVSEYGIQVNGLVRRCDIVIFDRLGQPKMIVECKATSIPVDDKVLFQIAQYNRELQVEYIMLSNGIEHFISKINAIDGSLEPMDDIQQEWFN